MTRRKESNPRVWRYPSFEECAVMVLKEAGRPMHYKEILLRVLEKRPVGGNTPEKTAYGALVKSKRIVRVARGGMFDLIENSSQINTEDNNNA